MADSFRAVHCCQLLEPTTSLDFIRRLNLHLHVTILFAIVIYESCNLWESIAYDLGLIFAETFVFFSGLEGLNCRR